MAGSGFRPLSNIPHSCLPYAFGPCLSPNVADHPLRPATDRRLGEPLPHQQANQTRANPPAINLSPRSIKISDVSVISSSFPELFRTEGYVPTRYSPVCHSVLLRRSTCMC